MRRAMLIVPGLAVALALLLCPPARAQQHRATRLGNPATRFAPPLSTPESVRALFDDERLKPDIAAILEQWGWKGNVEDLHRAALAAEISAVTLPVGTRMPFMSSREGGRPVCLRDVLWAGREPISAYAFDVSSNGRCYRCVIPRPCSNFYLEDLGPAPPKLELVRTAPAEASLCAPIEMEVAVRNAGNVAVTQVQVAETLPAGLTTPDHQTTLNLDAGTLRPGESRKFQFPVVAAAAGNYVLRARAMSAEGAQAEATASTAVRAPALALECAAPAEVLAGRPVEVCLTVRNQGDVPEPQVTLTLPLPAETSVTSITDGGVSSEGRVVWTLPNLAPHASRQVGAVLTRRPTGSLAFAPAARGSCAPAVQSACSTRIAGIPAILLELVDLEDPVEVGREVTYVITVTNQGTAVGTNIRIVGTLPASQEFISGTGATPVRAQDGTVTTEPLPALDPKAAASWRVVVKALQAGDIRFKVELSSDQFERPIPEDEATQQF